MLMNNAVYGETMEKVRKDNKLAITERRKLFAARIKLSYYKSFQRKSVSERNEELQYRSSVKY